MRLISWRHVLFWCVWYGLRSSRSESEQWVWCVNIETSSTRTQTIPPASEKDVTSHNQTHAFKKRTGRMPCAFSFSCFALRIRSEWLTWVFLNACQAQDTCVVCAFKRVHRMCASPACECRGNFCMSVSFLWLPRTCYGTSTHASRARCTVNLG